MTKLYHDFSEGEQYRHPFDSSINEVPPGLLQVTEKGREFSQWASGTVQQWSQDEVKPFKGRRYWKDKLGTKLLILNLVGRGEVDTEEGLLVIAKSPRARASIVRELKSMKKAGYLE
jgi:hypothetical protein